MRRRLRARWMVLTWALAGCGLGNPDLVLAPDGGIGGGDDVGSVEDLGFPEDLGVDVGAVDVGRDVGGRDVVGDVGGLTDVADGGVTPDVPVEDVGVDVVPVDLGEPDAGTRDTGTPDTGSPDTGVIDSGPRDSGPLDTGPVDSGVMDAGPRDTGVDVPVVVDNGPPDVGTPDVGTPDVGTPDAGPTVVGAFTESCSVSGTGTINGPGRYLMAGTTAGRANEHRASCAGEGGQTGDNPDVGYLITLTGLSRLRWTARPTGATTFTPVISITQSCNDQGGGDRRFRDEVACVENGSFTGFNGGGTVDLPAGNYYLVVDGYRATGAGATSGAYEVNLEVTAWENSPAYSQELLTTLRCSTVPGAGPGRAEIMDGDDTVSTIQALGFSFNYFGQAFDRLAFYSNGFLAFITSEATPWNDRAWRNHSIAFTGQPRGVVAPFWDDLEVNGSGDVYFWIDGTAPNRVAHVYWQTATFYRDGGTNISFEARLFQTSNVIEFVYCAENRNNNYSRGGEATIGLESYDQTQGRLVSLNRTGAVAPNTGYRFTPR